MTPINISVLADSDIIPAQRGAHLERAKKIMANNMVVTNNHGDKIEILSDDVKPYQSLQIWLTSATGKIMSLNLNSVAPDGTWATEKILTSMY